MKLVYAILVFGLFFLPFFLLGEDAYVQIHDNLENELVYIVHIVRSGHWLDFSSNANLLNIMEGISRNAFRSGINFTFLLFSFLPAYWAYVANKMIVHAIGAVGMFLLLKNHFNLADKKVSVFIALAFSLIPYSSIFCGIAISGQPLLFFAFLNVLKGRGKWSDMAIILLFPFMISPLLIAPFSVLALLVLYATYVLFFNKYSPRYLVLLGLFGLVCLLIEYPLLKMSLFDSNFISHRKEINRINVYNLMHESVNSSFHALWFNFVKMVFHGKWHSGNFLNIPIWLLAVWSFCTERKSRSQIIFVVSVVFFINLYTGFSNLVYLYISPQIASVLNLYSAERLYFLQPTMMFVLFAVSIKHLNGRYDKNIISCCLALQFALIILANLYPKENIEWKNNLLIIFGQKEKMHEPTFAQFFDTQLYRHVQDYIGKDVGSYRIANVNLPSSASQYNGFYTLDSYQNNYDIRFKYKFRRVIEKELGKNSLLKNYYDENGSRCYLFSSETLGRLIGKNDTVKIHHAQWNMNLLKQMNCRYILSAVPITNYKELGMNFEGVFQTEKSFWKIHLYRLD